MPLTKSLLSVAQRVVPGSTEEGEELQSPDAPPKTPTPPHSTTGPHNTFDYLYEFSETRKVLEEFFKPGDTKEPSPQPFQVTNGKKVCISIKVENTSKDKFVF